MLELMVLGFAGLLAGAALGAAKARAPRPIIVTFLVMAGMALVLAAVLLASA